MLRFQKPKDYFEITFIIRNAIKILTLKMTLMTLTLKSCRMKKFFVFDRYHLNYFGEKNYILWSIIIFSRFLICFLIK